MIRKGDRVTFKPEWQNKGDSDRVFVAMSDESKGRVDVREESFTAGPFKPWHTASTYMIVGGPDAPQG